MSVFTESEQKQLQDCRLCPRECGANRFEGPLGYCNSGEDFKISGICIHKGEEPVISGTKGICNVFFSHCNLQCIYCQNHEISGNRTCLHIQNLQYGDLIKRICTLLDETENILGFVSPTHYIPQMKAIIRGVHEKGKHPVIVYNSNGYDKSETLRELEGLIDVYLPDFKYIDSELSLQYSGASDYPEVAMQALREMYRQKGATLIVNDRGIAESGIIVRHLVLPHATEQSIKILENIAEALSPKIHLSLMAQYYPTHRALQHPLLNRSITQDEYKQVVEAFHRLGFYRGWIQDLSSERNYRPDFLNNDPFLEQFE